MAALPPLQALLADLRAARLPVGITEVLRLRQVFRGAPRLPADPQAARRRLRAILRAVILHTQANSDTFDQVFDAWWRERERDFVGITGTTLVAPEPEPPPAGLLADIVGRMPTRARDGLILALAGLVLAAGYGVIILAVATTLFMGPVVGPVSSPLPDLPPSPLMKQRVASSGSRHPRPLRPLTLEELRGRTRPTWVPVIAVTPGAPCWIGWLPLGLTSIALLTTLGIWVLIGRRSMLPEGELGSVPPAVRPPEPARPAEQQPWLLDRQAQETLVWGIGRFVAEEPGGRLDLAATVAATARSGGQLALRFVRELRHREVWLWLDDSVADPTLARLADEVAQTLEQHGLAVEIAWFRGVPDWLETPAGQVFAPGEVDERRDFALVAILTDGRLLRRWHGVETRRPGVEAVLRLLSHWPHLAFVDFSAGDAPLAPFLQPRELDCIAPSGLAGFLGADTSAAARSEPVIGPPGATSLWTAACCLAPVPVAPTRAVALKQALALEIPGLEVRALYANAERSGTRLTWSPAGRSRYLRWLIRAEAHPAEGVAPNSLLARALDFWKAEYAGLDEAAAQHPRVRMEQAFLDLWRDPGPAVRALYRLHQGPLRAEVTDEIRHLAPRDWAGPRDVPLPWSAAAQPPEIQYMLAAIGAAGAPKFAGLRTSGRLWLGMGAAAGLAVAALLAMLVAGSAPSTARPTMEVVDGGPPTARAVLEAVAEREARPVRTLWLPPANAPGVDSLAPPAPTADPWQLWASTHEAVADSPVPAGSQVRVSWNLEDKSCLEPLPNGGERWRCGTMSALARLDPALGRSLALLLAQPDTPGVAELAAALLTGGSVDQVLIAPTWPAGGAPLLGPDSTLRSGDRLLVLRHAEEPARLEYVDAGGRLAAVAVPEWVGLAEALDFADPHRPLLEVWPSARVELDDPGALRLAGTGGCRPAEEPADANGLVFVRLCPGTFQMGSPDDEVGRDTDEGPVHEVRVDAFALMGTEVTNAQYAAFLNAVGQRGSKDQRWLWTQDEYQGSRIIGEAGGWRVESGFEGQPMVAVTWYGAKAFCEHYGYRLPSEAEWEYAARAGTTTRFSFGDDEGQLGDYAWFTGNSGDELHPIGTKAANPWGLHDLHGNAWEWVEDCWHDSYEGAPADGSAWVSGECAGRVLRGGAFDYVPRGLRSAFRGWDVPEIRGGIIGFRCARAARRQP